MLSGGVSPQKYFECPSRAQCALPVRHALVPACRPSRTCSPRRSLGVGGPLVPACSSPITPLFSHSCPRVRNLLKTRDFNYLCFHIDVHFVAATPLQPIRKQNQVGVFWSTFRVTPPLCGTFPFPGRLLRFRGRDRKMPPPIGSKSPGSPLCSPRSGAR